MVQWDHALVVLKCMMIWVMEDLEDLEDLEDMEDMEDMTNMEAEWESKYLSTYMI